jgi:hypothetical protein
VSYVEAVFVTVWARCNLTSEPCSLAQILLPKHMASVDPAVVQVFNEVGDAE